MAKPTIYAANALTGGADGALDSIDGAKLSDGDFAVAVTATTTYHYQLDDDSAAAEDSPRVIAPDDNPGDKRWILIAEGLLTEATAAELDELTDGSETTLHSHADPDKTFIDLTDTPNEYATADIGNILVVKDDLTGLEFTDSPTFEDLILSTPSNIYNLSHNSFADFAADEHIDWKTNTESSIDVINKFNFVRSLVPLAPSGRLFLLDLTTYNVFETNVVGTGSVIQSFGLANVATGATDNSSSRQNLNAQEVYDLGLNITKCYTTVVTGNCFAFIGVIRALKLTTQSAKELTTKHAAFIYEDGTWYCSVADGSTQTIESITSLTGIQVLEIDGSESGHVKFRVGGTIVKDFTTNLAQSYGYFQWYIHNKTTSANKSLAFYTYAYTR